MKMLKNKNVLILITFIIVSPELLQFVRRHLAIVLPVTINST